jgi:hypothetical protein
MIDNNNTLKVAMKIAPNQKLKCIITKKLIEKTDILKLSQTKIIK